MFLQQENSTANDFSSWFWFCDESTQDENHSSIDVTSPSGISNLDDCITNTITALSHVPFFIICVVVLVFKRCTGASRRKSRYLYRWPGHTCRWVITFILLVLATASIAEGLLTDMAIQKLLNNKQLELHYYLPACFLFITNVTSLLYYQLAEIWREPRMCCVLLMYWLSCTIAGGFRLTVFYQEGVPIDCTRLWITSLLMIVHILLVMVELNLIVFNVRLFMRRIRGEGHNPHDRLKHEFSDDMKFTENYVSYLYYVTFWWMNWLFKLGYNRPLEIKDLGTLPEVHKSHYLYKKFKEDFERELEQKTAIGQKPSVWKVFGRVYKNDIIYAGLCRLMYDLACFVAPLSLNGVVFYVITYGQQDEEISSHKYVTLGEFFSNGFVLLGVICFANVMQNIMWQQNLYTSNVIGVHIRTAIQTMVYDKSLRLSSYVMSGGGMTVGEITNHMSTDAMNLFFFSQRMHYLWAVPFRVIAVLILMYFQIGTPTLIAFAVLLVAVPLQLLTARIQTQKQKAIMKSADDRLKKSNEMLLGIKLLKLYGWEEMVCNGIERVRKLEMTSIFKYNGCYAINFFVVQITPTLLNLAVFVSYPYLIGQPLQPNTTFAALSLMNLLGEPMYFVPMVTSLLVNAFVGVSRIQTFLMAKETESIPDVIDVQSIVDVEVRRVTTSVEFSNHISTEEYDETAPLLKDVPSPIAVNPTPYSNGSIRAHTDREQTHEMARGRNTHAIKRVTTSVEFSNHISTKEYDETAPLLKDVPSPIAVNPTPYSNGSIRAHTDREQTHEMARGRNTHAIKIINADFTWDDECRLPVLQDINLEITHGELVMIVGCVGSGKSSLLSAMLGEMNTLSGSVEFVAQMDTRPSVSGTAYCAQTAWLMNASLRDNILFGNPYDRTRYRKVIEASALEPDIDILPGGDMTEIGEKGINLSGGQKQRISVARAMYSNKQIVLLDDPLSALDVNVGGHLFHRGIIKRLKRSKRTVVLVTHQLQYLQYADKIIVMRNGKITLQGTFDDLTRDDPDLYLRWQKDMFAATSEHGESDLGNSGSDSVEERETLKKQVSLIGNGDVNRNNLTTEEVLDKHDKGQLIQREELARGSVSLSAYMYYIRSMGVACAISFGFSRMGLESINISRNFWLSDWSEAGLNVTLTISEINSDYLASYIGLSFGCLVLAACTCFASVTASWNAASRVFLRMLRTISRAPMRFFDTTPNGRVLNRFSIDTQIIDTKLLVTTTSLVHFFAGFLFAVIVNAIITPIFLVEVLPIIIIYYIVGVYFIRSSRELQRLDSVTRSPVFAHFSETLGGLTTIRAYRDQTRFFGNLLKRIDTNNTPFLYLQVAYGWLGLQMSMCGGMMVLMVGLTTLLQATVLGTLDASLVGLGLTYVFMISQQLFNLIRFSADTEMQMNPVERVQYYAMLPREDYEGSQPPPEWPRQGGINISHLSVRYADTLPPVLRNVSLTVRPGEKVGICGRTGSGKSTLTLALFRLINTYKGRITIDGVNIAHLPITTLRQRLSIIPQDPVLFTGTIRSNLDPRGKVQSDEDLWHALEIAQLKTVVTDSRRGLDTLVSEGGENFSVGQRQLFCLARAFLKKSRILIMDEATASIDYDTERVLQEVVASVFQDKTVLVVAHRVSTILGSDTIWVLDQGRVIECDSPENLLARPNSVFNAMVEANK